MKKVFVVIVVTICSLMSVVAQNQENAQNQTFLDVNVDSIKSFVTENNDVYKALLDRYISGDTTLTVDDCAIIYYGYSFNPIYEGEYVSTTEANSYFRAGKYDKARPVFEKSLSYNPVSLENIYKTMVCAYFANDMSKYEVLNLRFQQLVMVILLTGDGTSADSGFWVIDVGDEYQILYNVLKIGKVNSQALVSGKNGMCDEMNVTFEGKDVNIYFNVSLSMLKWQRMFDK